MTAGVAPPDNEGCATFGWGAAEAVAPVGVTRGGPTTAGLALGVVAVEAAAAGRATGAGAEPATLLSITGICAWRPGAGASFWLGSSSGKSRTCFHWCSGALQINCEWVILPSLIAVRIAVFGISFVSAVDPLTCRIRLSPGRRSGISLTGFHALSSGLQINCEWVISPFEIAARIAGFGSSRVCDSVPFLINVPIGVAAFSGALRVLPRTVAHPELKLDAAGMALVGVALTAIIYPLIQGREAGWPAWTFVMIGAGLALLGGFLFWERRRRSAPLIDPRLLANRSYTSGLLVVLAFFGAFGGLILCVSLWAQLGEGFTPVHAGLSLIAMVVGMVIGMVAGVQLVAKLGRNLVHLGIGLVGAGTVGLALTVGGADSATTLDLAPSLFVIGLGVGSSLGQLFDFILAGVGMDEVGSASGVLEAVQQLSSAVGVAALGTIFFSAFGDGLPTHALAVTAWCCLPLIAATFLLVFMLPMHPREEGN